MGQPTAKMLGKLHSQLAGLGVTDRDEKLRVLSAVVYRRIESSKQLTFDEARACLDTLGDIAAHESPRVALDRMVATAQGQVTKIKRRVGRGVCPCCNRTFADLGRHMAGQHPDYAETT